MPGIRRRRDAARIPETAAVWALVPNASASSGIESRRLHEKGPDVQGLLDMELAGRFSNPLLLTRLRALVD